MKLYFTGNIKELETGIRVLAEDYDYEISEDGIRVQVEKSDKNGLCVKRDGKEGYISYGEKVQFFRALGLFLQESKKSEKFELCEDCMFTMNGAMFDVSQGNAVMRVEMVKDYLKRMAVMGLNMLMLYSEDSYEVKNQPYFGYMRSKYTEEELRECDDFAYDLGIEMIPCIQTLAHFIDVLKWDTYFDMRDDYETLLVGSEKAYGFIEDLIASACRPFRTKRIHIGMDEAWHLGLGNYLRNASEAILFGTHGKAPVKFKSQPNWVFAPTQDHSRKPEEQYAIIERVSPEPYLELFARRHQPGWDAWGNEIASDIVIPDYPVPSYSDKAALGKSE